MSINNLKKREFFKKNKILNNVPSSSFKEKSSFKTLFNKKGSSLILALVAIALISILSTLVMSMSLTAYKASVQNKYADEDFFYCEEYLEDARGAAVKITNDIFLKSYLEVSSFLTVLTPDEVNTAFREGVFTELENNTDLKALFNKEVDAVNDEDEVIGKLKISYAEYVVDTNKSTFKDVKVELIDGKRENNTNFYASITTDIIIEVPKLVPDVTDDHQGALEYIFVSEGDLIFQSGTSAINVSGNIYAGNDLLNSQSNVKFFSDYITICNQLKTNQSLSISGYSETANIWCKDIIIDGKGSSTTMYGNMYVKDDLEVNNSGCSVQLSGKYYGYGDDPSTPNYNSAILINGSGTLFDMTGIEELAIKGNSFLTIDNNSYYQGAESLATIVSQSMYMVNAEYIDFGNKRIKIGDKRVSFSDIGIDSYLSTHAVITGGVKVENANTFANDYLNLDKMITFDTYTVDGKNYICLYWNFKGEMGEKFISSCIEKGLIDGFLDKFMNGGYIKLNPYANIGTTADIYEYVLGSDGYTANKITSGLDNDNINSKIEYIEKFSNAYEAFKADLKPESIDLTGTITVQSPSVFEGGCFNPNIISAGTYELLNGKNGFKHLIVGGNLTIKDEGWELDGAYMDDKTYNGVIFVNGDVTIQSNVNFRGMIVATGKIEVSKGTYSFNEEAVKDFIHLLKDTNSAGYIWKDLVSDSFYTYVEYDQSGTTALNADELIKYENWTRNRDK